MKPLYVIIVIGTLLVIFMVLASKQDKVIDIKPKSLLTTPTPMQYNAHPSPMGTPGVSHPRLSIGLDGTPNARE